MKTTPRVSHTKDDNDDDDDHDDGDDSVFRFSNPLCALFLSSQILTRCFPAACCLLWFLIRLVRLNISREFLTCVTELSVTLKEQTSCIRNPDDALTETRKKGDNTGGAKWTKTTPQGQHDTHMRKGEH